MFTRIFPVPRKEKFHLISLTRHHHYHNPIIHRKSPLAVYIFVGLLLFISSCILRLFVSSVVHLVCRHPSLHFWFFNLNSIYIHFSLYASICTSYVPFVLFLSSVFRLSRIPIPGKADYKWPQGRPRQSWMNNSLNFSRRTI